MSNWTATNVNYWGDGTISDAATLPFYYVISRAGIILERDDGDVRKFRLPTTAQAAADKMNREDGPPATL